MRRLAALIALLSLVAPVGSAHASQKGQPSEKAGRPHLPPPLPSPREIQALGAYSHTLLELDRARGRLAVPLLRREGGVLVSRTLRIWRLDSRAAQRLVPRLERARLLRAVEPDRVVASTQGHLTAGDPLLPNEWWVAAVGADQVEPPGPGVPVAVIDTGLDSTHPEFAGRPDTTALNTQDPTPGVQGEEHGTAVSSVVGAPANGVGVVGVYPQAVLLEWDAGDLSTGNLVAGLQAAVDAGARVINMSYGGPVYDRMEEEAVLVAFGRGAILVAASGNEYEQGNPIEFPASFNHVLTVSASTQDNKSAYFSSASLAVDLAAPGVSIPVAVPTWLDPSGFSVYAGTSFAAPLVAGATAWVWTARPDLDNTQVFDLMRYSAKDIWEPGFDEDTGYGLLDIPAALTAPAPTSDHEEPNDDIDEVKANGLFAQATAPLTAPDRPRRTITARLDLTEDPEDVYRVWVPGRRSVVIRVRGDDDVDVELWRPDSPSVYVKGRQKKQYLIAGSYEEGTAVDTVSVTNSGRRGAYVYLDVYLPEHGPLDAAYSASIRTVRTPSSAPSRGRSGRRAAS